MGDLGDLMGAVVDEGEGGLVDPRPGVIEVVMGVRGDLCPT